MISLLSIDVHDERLASIVHSRAESPLLRRIDPESYLCVIKSSVTYVP
jgi:hypothetical protein